MISFALKFAHIYLVVAFWLALIGVLIYPLCLALLEFPIVVKRTRFEYSMRVIFCAALAFVLYFALYAQS